MTIFRSSVILAIPLVLGLGGCSDGGIHEVQQWMDDVRRGTKASIPPLSEPKKFTPFLYTTTKDVIDPYNPSKLAIALAKAKADSGRGFTPDLDRRREPLESYPLDTLKMVGTLQRAGLSYALLQTGKVLFHAKVGNYIGQDLGMITKITETEVDIKEIVQDAAGDWVERKAQLELQETKK